MKTKARKSGVGRLIRLIILIALAWSVYFFVTHRSTIYQRFGGIISGGTQQVDSGEKYSSEDFGIAEYVSSVDYDGDGIDDQTDILENVREYIATSPQYKSNYYAGGYPDDGYGVCTDVVAFGLLGAGYDLRQLVYDDKQANPEAYSNEIRDINIDFRRVRNLLIYFERHAISLTTDVTEISEWQGGDIVVFENHIGVVSDIRNENGTPWVIHHGSSTQSAYEQDILELRDDIVGHFRIS